MPKISGTELGLSFDVLTIGLLGIIAAALRVSPSLWAAVVGPNEKNRIHTLDGARGLLTTWVLSHHLMLASVVDAHGSLRAPSGALGVLLQSGFFVAPFFMLTAMLFGGRLLARPGEFDARSFFIKRSFRLIPVYVLAVSVLILGAFIETSFTFRQPVWKVAKEVGRWLLFDFVHRNEVNGVRLDKHYGVLWTLRYEILFYALLPILAYTQRVCRNRYVIIALLAAIGTLSWPFIYFAVGAICPICLRKAGSKGRLSWQVAAVSGIAIICVTASYGVVSHWLQALCLVPTFVCLALELPLFRPLRWRPFRLIGEASYSSYVLHGATIFIVSQYVVDPNSISAYNFVPRMAWLLLYAVVVTSMSVLVFVLVERPFIQLGSKLINSGIGTRIPRSGKRLWVIQKDQRFSVDTTSSSPTAENR